MVCRQPLLCRNRRHAQKHWQKKIFYTGVRVHGDTTSLPLSHWHVTARCWKQDETDSVCGRPTPDVQPDAREPTCRCSCNLQAFVSRLKQQDKTGKRVARGVLLGVAQACSNGRSGTLAGRALIVHGSLVASFALIAV